MSYLASFITTNTVIYLDELQEKLETERNIEISITTISRAPCHLAISHRNVAALERNEELRAIWQVVNGKIPMEYFVWIDEATIDDHTNQQNTD
ncbi:hypothetical protein BDQ17DRAFT_1247076 [Cyathus striatus]|nr:hypothetical protein BDQ17DRAFT_1247076 [Cyathus striatus]